jgi:uncharacterized protein (TIGR01777 family)
MRILVTGGSGFLGRRLCAGLLEAGHELLLLGRAPKRGMPAAAEFATWNPESGPPPAAAIEGAEAIIHLAGEPVGQRWTGEVKRRIRSSRVTGTRNLVKGIELAQSRPKVLLSASAIGFYGERGNEDLNESSPVGTGFLPDICKEWEATARGAQDLGCRVVLLRTGVVLGEHGGALDRMLLPFRMGLGGRIGSGDQWISWIHIADAIGLMQFALNQSKVSGPLNLTAPEPVTNATFTTALAKALGRPAILPIPVAALRLLLGEMASVLVESQRVLPVAARKAGYQFHFPKLPAALADILQPPPQS